MDTCLLAAASDAASGLDLLRRNAAEVRYILPELLLLATLVGGGILLLAWRAVRRTGMSGGLLPWRRYTPEWRRSAPLTTLVVSLGLLGTAAVVCLWQWPQLLDHDLPTRIFAGSLYLDPLSGFFQFLILSVTLLAVLATAASRELDPVPKGEFILLTLAAGLGALFLASAASLLMLYLALEFVSLISYVLAGFLARHRRSSEAGMKYVLYGAFASGLMLFGISYVYGLTGSLDPEAIRGSLQELILTGRPGTVVVVELLLLLLFAGLGYKIAAVPFHLWSPDVYEGAPTVATAFFSVVPKAAGFAALLRLVAGIWGLTPGALAPALANSVDAVAEWHAAWPVVPLGLGAFAVLTMTVGNVTALRQTNAKRLLAYSSIAHAGYLLAALAVPDHGDGPRALLFYLAVYAVMNFGAFAVIIALENRTGSAELRELAGAVRYAPGLVVAMVVFLFALVGLPPTAGFFAKLLVLKALIENAAARPVLYWGLVAAILINTVISLVYYLRLAQALCSGTPTVTLPAVDEVPAGLGALINRVAVQVLHGVVYALAVLTVGLLFAADGLQQLCAAVFPGF